MKKLFALLRLMRPRQWTKNVFVLAPLIFGFKLLEESSIVSSLGAIAVFCLLSSAIYVINDILDFDADKKHPRKKQRPLVSKLVTIPEAVGLIVTLLIAATGFLLLGNFDMTFWIWTGLYAALSLGYCFGLKDVSLLELFIVASGYVLRMLAGCAAIHVLPTPWILAGTGTIALFIVAGKRRSELAENHDTDSTRRSLRSYNLTFLDSTITMLAATTFVTYLLFTTSAYAIERYDAPYFIGTSIFVLYGILRYMQLVKVKAKTDDPTTLMLTDPGLCLTVLGWILACIGVIYF